MSTLTIRHHGAVDGVTGSCHELVLADGRSILVDCGLFQGSESSPSGAALERQRIDFPIDKVEALVVTHVHIDHVGRIPYLLAAGFSGPILCSLASAELLPMVLEDALKVGFTRDKVLIERVLELIRRGTQGLPYDEWHEVIRGNCGLRIRLQPAGHILGSAYVECDVAQGAETRRVVFSGDLGPPDTPLLPDPRPPERADVVVLESTYGDRNHEGRADRAQRLRAIIEHAFRNRGTVLIPAFSIGRTQELLYELEHIIHGRGEQPVAEDIAWNDVEIVLDSPLAADFTRGYARLREYWDQEAKQRLDSGRHPLDFEQLLTIDDHADHLRTVDYLSKSARPAVVIAASGMCAGGRVVNYLKAMLGDPRHDILFVGYQAEGTPGRAIQRYGPRGGYVDLDGKRYDIRAAVHTLAGYSAHADQGDLVAFIAGIQPGPSRVVLVHGDGEKKQALAQALRKAPGDAEIEVA